MSGLARDNIHETVGAGMISKAQDTSALARARSNEPGSAAGHDESFELFRGFNELFIVAGLIVLFTGIAGFVVSLGLKLTDDPAIFKIPPADFQSQFLYGGSALAGMSVVIALAHHFTLRHRMIAPSIILAVFFFACATMMGLAIGAMACDDEAFLDFSIGGAVATVLAAGYHFVFRVPFNLALVSFGALATALFATASVRTSKGIEIPESIWELILLSSEGPFSFIMFSFGLVFLAFALRYDLSDPWRITRRTDFAFWLHAVAALSIMHTIAPTLFYQESVTGKFLLFFFVLAMALFAVVIDRRCFIITGMGYSVLLIITLPFKQVHMPLALILGLGLVYLYLGAKWEVLRCRLMRFLPSFPGKCALPPWELAIADDESAISGPHPQAREIGTEEVIESGDTGATINAKAAYVLDRSSNVELRQISDPEEPFVLYRNFNEIFIASGLIILGVVWLVPASFIYLLLDDLIRGIWLMAGMFGMAPLAWYFTVRRQLVAPSIILPLLFFWGAHLMANVIHDSVIGHPYLTGNPYLSTAGITTLLLVGYYCLFRVPFALVLVALGFYVTVLSATKEFPEILFLLSGEGLFSLAMSTVLGLVFFGIALVFDMSDPNRVTRRADCGFWMHIAAALAIANTVSAVHYALETASTQLLLALFVLLMALFAMIIDRRSFLVVGAGYIIAILFGLPEGSFGVFAFAQLAGFGLILVYLGAGWHVVRRWLMRNLPDFPGKNRLPPWDLISR